MPTDLTSRWNQLIGARLPELWRKELNMTKELYIAAHEDLIDQYMEEWDAMHPNASDAERRKAESLAYDNLADKAYEHMRDSLANKADHYRQMKKDGML